MRTPKYCEKWAHILRKNPPKNFPPFSVKMTLKMGRSFEAQAAPPYKLNLDLSTPHLGTIIVITGEGVTVKIGLWTKEKTQCISNLPN